MIDTRGGEPLKIYGGATGRGRQHLLGSVRLPAGLALQSLSPLLPEGRGPAPCGRGTFPCRPSRGGCGVGGAGVAVGLRSWGGGGAGRAGLWGAGGWAGPGAARCRLSEGGGGARPAVAMETFVPGGARLPPLPRWAGGSCPRPGLAPRPPARRGGRLGAEASGEGAGVCCRGRAFSMAGSVRRLIFLPSFFL